MITSFNEFNNRPVIDHFALSNPMVKRPSSPINEIHAMAKYGLSEFKSLFEGILFESEGYSDEALLEKTHVCYELDMLSEAKSHWFETEGEVVTIDAGDHMILVKNNEAYIISANTYNSINEFWTWGDAQKAWNNLKTKVSTFAAEKYKQAKEVAAKAWDAMSVGAKKSWDFVKTCTAAAVKFASGLSWKECASLGLTVMSAFLGLNPEIPGAPVGSAICIALSGGVHLWEGFEKLKHATDTLSTIKDITPFAKNSAAFTKALPDILIGALFVSLGFHDLSNTIKALTDPLTGAVATGVKIGAIQKATSLIGKIGKNTEHFLAGYVTSAAGLVGSKIPKLAAEGIVKVLITVIGEVVLSKTIGWLWAGLMKTAKDSLSGLQFLLDLPAKITATITTMQKNSTSTIGIILAKGLATIVKPMSEGIAKVIAKYIKPLVDKAQKWLNNQIAAYDICMEELKKHESEVKGAEEVPVTKDRSTFTPKNIEVEKSDLEKIKKLPPINKEIEKAAEEKGYEVPNTNVEGSSTPTTNESYQVLLFDQFNSNLSRT